MGAGLTIVPVPVLQDNYVWLVHDEASGETAAVDPSVGPPVLEAADARGWRITQVLNTHWHPDHTGGNQAIHEATGAPVTGPDEVRRVYQPDRVVGEGDSLFAMGCGRLFEGTAGQMHANLQRLAALPDDVRVYCGHEYTLANARFAVTVEPDNPALAERLHQVEAARGRGEVTLPTTIGEERSTNPFVRAASVEEFARLRAMKDSFG